MNTTSIRSTFSAPTFSASAFAPKADAAHKRPSFLGRFVQRLIAGQERRARQVVWAHLAHQPDEALVRLGWTPAEIADMRRQVSTGVAYPL